MAIIIQKKIYKIVVLINNQIALALIKNKINFKIKK